MVALAVTLLLAQASPSATPQAAQGSAPASWQHSFDQLWKRRDAPGVEKELERILQQQLAAEPHSFEADWRLASLYNWEADARDIDSDAKAALGRKAWGAADKAVLENSGDVRGHYNAAVGIGLYSEGIGILSALSQGLEGKFRERILAALRIDRDYMDGAPQVVWGRYFFKLPWPKRDLDKATSILTEVVRSHPRNLRAKLFLADCYADSNRVEEGKALVQQVLAAEGGDDPPDERRLRTRARNWIEAHGPPNLAQ